MGIDIDPLKLVDELAGQEGISAEEVEKIKVVVAGKDDISLPADLVAEDGGANETKSTADVIASASAIEAQEKVNEKKNEDIRYFISKATLPQKIKLAMFGSGTCRAILIRDTSKLIQGFVLKNPQLQLREVEEFVKNPNVSEFVIRTVGNNQAWMKSYHVKLSIVSNPKTPGDISLKWIRYLVVGDLKRLAKSKNVPQVVSVMARKRVAEIGSGKK